MRKNRPAFPLVVRDRHSDDAIFNQGISRFEYFIAAALQTASPKDTPEKVAQWAIETARAVMNELENETIQRWAGHV